MNVTKTHPRFLYYNGSIEMFSNKLAPAICHASNILMMFHSSIDSTLSPPVLLLPEDIKPLYMQLSNIAHAH